MTDEHQESQLEKISIHAPREGGDSKRKTKTISTLIISIHAPREGGDGGCRL